jgi:mitochondrial distribution and morphology protein 31
MAWITSGKFDVVADIRFPREIPDDVDINAIISEIASNISGLVHGDTRPGEDDSVDRPIPGQHLLSTPAIEAPVTTVGQHAQRTTELPGELAAQRHEKDSSAAAVDVEDAAKEAKDEEEMKLVIPPPTVVIDIDIRFKDVKAAVPLFAKDLSYRNNALMRPIVAFMNANRTLIPVHARIVMDLVSRLADKACMEIGLLTKQHFRLHAERV